jgi:hypothetical protein
MFNLYSLKLSGKVLLFLFALLNIPPLSLSAQVSISAVSPLSGPIGSAVNITGSHFDPVAANDIVYFGAVRAQVSSASATSLSVLVPAGASYQPVTVTADGLTAYSGQSFDVTFPGEAGTRTFSDSIYLHFTNITTGSAPIKSVVADLDGDGKPDIITANASTDVIIFQNSSSGNTISFPNTIELGATDSPLGNVESIASGDIDGDGKTDIIVSTNIGISIFVNKSSPGTIAFASREDFSAPLATAINVADVDNDGKPDVILVNNLADLGILKNTSSAGVVSFAPIVTYSTDESGGSENLSVGDLDGDGLVDIAVSNGSYNTVSIFINASTSSSIALKPKVDFATGTNPLSIAIGDLDGDGKPDLAVVNGNDNSIFIMRNSTTGGAVSFAKALSISTSTSPQMVTISDIDGDGRPDLGEVNMIDNSAYIYHNTSTIGAFSFTPPLGLGTSYGPVALSFNDLNGDGPPELVVSDKSSRLVNIIKNDVAAPHLNSISPTVVGPGGTVSIKGSNLLGTTAVSFGGTAALSFKVMSDSLISATVGYGNSGTVSVANIYGVSAIAGLTVTTLPVITFFTPDEGLTGDSIRISGVNFTGATAVHFGSDVAKSFTPLSDTVIMAVIGHIVPGDLSISVTNYAGTESLSGFYSGFKIKTISAANEYVGGAVTIAGTGFSPSPGNNELWGNTSDIVHS